MLNGLSPAIAASVLPPLIASTAGMSFLLVAFWGRWNGDIRHQFRTSGFSVYGVTYIFFDFRQVKSIVLAGEADRIAPCSQARRAPDPVYIVGRILW
jgi:hypothetical protein